MNMIISSVSECFFLLYVCMRRYVSTGWIQIISYTLISNRYRKTRFKGTSYNNSTVKEQKPLPESYTNLSNKHGPGGQDFLF